MSSTVFGNFLREDMDNSPLIARDFAHSTDSCAMFCCALDSSSMVYHRHKFARSYTFTETFVQPYKAIPNCVCMSVPEGAGHEMSPGREQGKARA